MKIRIGLFFALASILVFSSCATKSKAYIDIDAGVQRGSYDFVLASMNDENGDLRKKVYTHRNEIMFYLDRGMVNHYAGYYEESSQDFQIAEQLIEEAFTKSMSAEVGSYLLNDNVKEYAGEDYEDLYVNVFNSLNYYHIRDIEGSLVEIRRLNEKLMYLADKYERATQKAAKSNSQVNTADLPMEASKYSNSALARYLGMLFFRAAGKMDDARIDFNELKRAFELAPEVYNHSIPSSVNSELSIPKEKARLNVLVFTGLSPVKEEENIIIPLPLPFPNNTAKLALPKMVERPSMIQSVEVVLNSGEKFRLEQIEDMGAVARETFKSKRGLIIVKTTARSIAKAAVSATAAEVAARRGGGLLGLLVGAVGRIASDVSEQADIRLSRFFPSRALVGGITLDPGTYTVTVNYYGLGLAHSEQRELNVRSNTLNLGQFFYLQ